jgi:hypothetical protein
VGLASLILLGVFLIYLIFILPVTKERKEKKKQKALEFESIREKEKRIEANLDDERLFDPITGKYITMEEAESGNWEIHSEDGIIPEDVIRDNYSPEQQERKLILNHLIANEYEKSDLETEEAELYEGLELLKPLDWSWSSLMKNNNTGLSVMYIYMDNPNRQGLTNAKIIQIPLPFDAGHCVVKSKVSLGSYIRNSLFFESEESNAFETVVFEKSNHEKYINTIMEGFEEQEDLVFEFVGNNLYVIVDFEPTYEEFLQIGKTLGF